MTTSPQAPYLPLSRDYTVLSSELREDGLHVAMECSLFPTECPFCASRQLGKWGARPFTFRDLPYKGQPVQISGTVRRYRCQSCDKLFNQELPEVAEKRQMTKRLLYWIGDEGVQRTFVSIAKEIGVTETTVRNAFNDFVALLEEAVHIATPTHLALLEVVALASPRVLALNTQSGTVVDMLATPDKIKLHGYLGGLRTADRVEFVSLGFSHVAMEAACANLPHAVAFIDKPYVLDLVDGCLQGLIEQLVVRLDKATRTALGVGRKSDTVNLLRLMQRVPSEQDAQAMEMLFLRSHLLREAYQLREALHAVYDNPTTTPEDAGQRIQAAVDTMSDEGSGVFAAFIDAWSKRRAHILAFFKPGAWDASIAKLGDLSGLGGAIDRYGRGYAFEAVRCKLLFPERVPAFSFSSPGLSVGRLLVHGAGSSEAGRI